MWSICECLNDFEDYVSIVEAVDDGCLVRSDGCPLTEVKDRPRDSNGRFSSGINDDWIYIEFKHYIDVLRHRFFKDKVESDEAYLTLTQNEKDFLASVQKDIDSYREENLRETERLLQK